MWPLLCWIRSIFTQAWQAFPELSVLLRNYSHWQLCVLCLRLFIYVSYLKLSSSYTHTHPFNGPLSGTTWVSQYYTKVKLIWILLNQEVVSGSGISWAICKSAPRSRQIAMPAPHHSVFYRPDALPAAQPTASKHWRQPLKAVSTIYMQIILYKNHCSCYICFV